MMMEFRGSTRSIIIVSILLYPIICGVIFIFTDMTLIEMLIIGTIAFIFFYFKSLSGLNQIIVSDLGISIQNDFRFWSTEVSFYYEDVRQVQLKYKTVPVIEICLANLSFEKYVCEGLSKTDFKNIYDYLNKVNKADHHSERFVLKLSI